jgi:2-oxoglutarate ferredoxin oxidoreductase subunit delta
MATETEPTGEAVATKKPAASKKKPKKNYIVLINDDWCKGPDCRICVTACPVNVIEMKGFSAVPARMEACTGCDLCEMKCPDFAIHIQPKN